MCFLKELIAVSERAANIARLCRQDEHLFNLLIEEKKEGEANPRFIQDFKTLADVLIQEMVKFYIGKKVNNFLCKCKIEKVFTIKDGQFNLECSGICHFACSFPEISKNVKGEESNVFTNSLNETIEIKLDENHENAESLLALVLNNDIKAAKLLCHEIYKVNDFEEESSLVEIEDTFDNLDNFGVWIDPIDATAEYIYGESGEESGKIFKKGLGCVTVLIGVFDLTTGNPIGGVINQPFYEKVNNRWRSKIYWGLSKNQLVSEIKLKESRATGIITISSSESPVIKEKLKNAGFNLVEVAGAGYKILTVITGLADAFVLSKNSTFFWDTCGPQAILKSQGGDLISFKHALNDEIRPSNYIKTKVDVLKIENYCNEDGLVAFKNTDILLKIIDVLK